MLKEYTRRQINYYAEGNIFAENEKAINEISSMKKRSKEATTILQKCKNQNMTLLSKNKFESRDKEETEKAFEELRERRKILSKI